MFYMKRVCGKRLIQKESSTLFETRYALEDDGSLIFQISSTDSHNPSAILPGRKATVMNRPIALCSYRENWNRFR